MGQSTRSVLVQPGDVRVQTSAGYPAVETLSLGLRFKERSFMKALQVSYISVLPIVDIPGIRRSREDANKMRPRYPASLGVQRHDNTRSRIKTDFLEAQLETMDIQMGLFSSCLLEKHRSFSGFDFMHI
ncbi:hypothetical protein OG21DRAFT_908583 [Imleria badia]|nr:hypothetical protein OG21DRAFT_908583 [Imleria badia]